MLDDFLEAGWATWIVFSSKMTSPAMENTTHDALIFIPTYNEAGNVAGILLRMILKLALPADVLVIDDNSTDGTADVVRRIVGAAPCVSLQSRPGKLGIGSAHLDALHYFKGNADIVFWLQWTQTSGREAVGYSALP